MQTPAGRFVDVNRVRLRVWEWGPADAPAILCVHGAQDHGRMWDGFAPLLAELGYRVVAPDVRGHGDSSRLASPHIWAASVLDLGLLVSTLGPPIGLIGHSFGGGQATSVAATWPERVKWLVTLDGLGPPAHAFEPRDIAASSRDGLDTYQRVRGRPPKVYGSIDDMVERRRRMNPRLSDEWLRHLVVHGSREIEAGYVWKHDPIFNIALPPFFAIDRLNAEHRHVTVPMLALTGGEHDTWSELTPAQLEDRLAHFPHAQYQAVPGAGHYLHIEQPSAVLDAIRAFIRS